MAKFQINAHEAIAELKVLIAEVENLKKSSSTLAQANADSFDKMEKSYTSLKLKVGEISNQMNYLNAILKKNKNVIENASKANTSAATKDISLIQAKIDMNDSLAKQKEREQVANFNNARKATEAVRAEDQARKDAINTKIKEAASTQSSREALQAQRESAIEANRAYNVLVGKQLQAKKALQDLIVTGVKAGQTQSQYNAQLRKAQADYDKYTASVNKAKVATGSFVAQTKKGVGGLTDEAGELIRAFGVLGGLALFADISKNVYDNIKTFDALNFALEKITETTIDYENSQKFLIQITQDYGVELVSTANRWLKFLAAAKQSGLSLRETEDIFRSMTKAASVLGLRTDELSGVYLALEQMLSKGKVTTEELRRQLGERLPGAMGIMAASMGKTIPELDKMLKKGEVLSAEVLPNFARAVEAAYGIESERKIETLTAAQDRLSTAWQNFIKNVAEGEGVLKKVIGGAIDMMTKALSGYDQFFESDNQNIRRRQSEMEEELRLEETAEKQLIALKENGFKDLKDLQEQSEQAKIAVNRAVNEEEKKEAQAHLEEFQALVVKVTQKTEELRVAEAAKSVANDRATYEEKLKIYEEYQAEMKKPVKGSFGAIWDSSTDYRDESKTKGVDEDELKNQVILYGSIYNYSRKLAQVSNVQVLPDEDDTKKRAKIIMRVLNEIYDLKREMEIGIIEKQIQANEELLESDRSSGTERANLVKKNAELRNRAVDIGYDIDEERARIHRDKEIASIEKSLREGKLLAKDAKNQIFDLNKEYDQKLILADQKRNSEIFDNNVQAQQDLINLLEITNQRKLDNIQNPYDEEVIGLKKVYEASAKTIKDQEALEKGLKRVALESANAQIRAKIALLRASINVSEMSSEEVTDITNEISKLEAAIQTSIPDAEGEGWKDYFSTILDYAGQFNAALGSLVDATHQRRIENIEAEIEAERNKYDKLIDLAEGDAEQQAVLRHNKEMAIDRLEKKRLKAEQKQAKARKAFAIADIAINTAAAIMGIWAQVPKFDFGISAGLLTAFVAGLGAVQTAAVIAAPIPQYAEGGSPTKDEIAMINDANAQEYVQRGNQILTTKTKNAIVQLKKGDTVYKDYDDMKNNSFLVPDYVKNGGYSEKDFNMLNRTISSGISKGFEKVKLQPIIKINNRSDNRAYKESLTNW